MCGGYTKFRIVDEDAKQIFEKALNGLVGVKYEPFAVSSQVVAGVNYIFLCNATAATNPPNKFTAAIKVFQPLNGDPVMQFIVPLEV